MMSYLIVFLGGGLGACARVAVSATLAHKIGTGFPWGTLSVNLIGALLIGIITETLALKYHLPPLARTFLVTGFLGGFTTFSAFSIESVAMIERGDIIAAIAYIGLSVVGTLALAFTGLYAVRMVF